MLAGWRTAHELYSDFAKLSYVNQLGYRGHTTMASDSEFSIVLGGDSQVECTSCPDDHLPEDALREAFTERGRKVRIISLGAAGFGADQELLALRSYFRAGYHADLVVVWQTPGNDIFNAMFPHMAPIVGVGKLKPTFRLGIEGELINPPGDIGELFCRWYLSCVYRKLRYGSMDAYWEQWLPAPTQPIAEASSLPVIDTAESIDRDKSHWSMWLEQLSPRMRYGIDLTRALYKEMAALAARHGAIFTLFDVNRHTALGLEELVKNTPMFQPGRKLVRHDGKLFAVGDQPAYLANIKEISAGFPSIIADIDIKDHVVSPDDGHLNQRGNKRVMEQLADALIAGGLFKPHGH
jgi:hypothetical protein